jgi:hypothetical protein
MRLTVVYEDQLGEPKPNNYGPHVLLLSCVEDVVKHSRFELQRHVSPLPKKGDGNVKKHIASLPSSAGEHLVLFDHDRVRRCYKLSVSACKSQVLEAIHSASKPLVGVVLLVENMETLVDDCCAVLRRPPPSKDRNARDAVLHAAAVGEPAVREAILQKNPSFARLVKQVIDWLVRRNLCSPNEGVAGSDETNDTP